MTIYALEIPDADDRLPAWLERHLVGLELRQLVRQLEVVHGTALHAATLGEVLGERIPAALEQGLAALAPEQLQALLRQPRLLLELQARICQEGGRHWSLVPLTDEHRQWVSAGADRLQSMLLVPSSASVAIDVAIPSAKPNVGSSVSPALARAGIPTRSRRAWLIAATSLAAAAVVWMAAMVFSRSAANAWGWEKPDIFAANLSAPDYLNHLADSAHEWFNKRPDTKQALAERLHQMSHGCVLLQNAPHQQLAAADRNWLLERCGAWSSKFNTQIASLESGHSMESGHNAESGHSAESGNSVLEIRTAADETVNKLIAALHDRAKQATH